VARVAASSFFVKRLSLDFEELSLSVNVNCQFFLGLGPVQLWPLARRGGINTIVYTHISAFTVVPKKYTALVSQYEE